MLKVSVSISWVGTYDARRYQVTILIVCARGDVPRIGCKFFSASNAESINLSASFRRLAFSTLTTVDHSIAVNNSSPDWAHGLLLYSFLIRHTIRSLLEKICIQCDSDVSFAPSVPVTLLKWTDVNTQTAPVQAAIEDANYLCVHTYRQQQIQPTCPRLNLIQINRGNTGSQSDAPSFTSGYLIFAFSKQTICPTIAMHISRSRNVDLGLAAARKQETWWQPLCTV